MQGWNRALGRLSGPSQPPFRACGGFLKLLFLQRTSFLRLCSPDEIAVCQLAALSFSQFPCSFLPAVTSTKKEKMGLQAHQRLWSCLLSNGSCKHSAHYFKGSLFS